jgi:hypothetical protein
VNPKDWKDAMHNEAEAVSDDNWAQDTKQAAWRFGWWEHMLGFLVAFGCALAVAVISFLLWEPLLAAFAKNSTSTYFTAQISFLIVVGACLGRLKLSPLGIGLGFGFLPLADGILTLLTALYTLSEHPDFQTDILNNIVSARSSWILPMTLLSAALTYAGALLGQRSSRRARTA